MIARGLAKENESWNSALNGFKSLDYIKVPFTDKNVLSLSDMPYIALANGSGIVGDRPNGSYDPDGLVTRAEASAMLKRYLNAKGKTTDTAQLVNKYKGDLRALTRFVYQDLNLNGIFSWRSTPLAHVFWAFGVFLFIRLMVWLLIDKNLIIN